MEKKLSIIVPIYEVGEYLSECIQSIVNQKYSNIEIILVDDGSKDNSPMICDYWADKDSRIRVIHKPNNGLVSARKAGLEIATGEYIGYVDGDDWIEEDMYTNMMQVVNQQNVDIVISGFKKQLNRVEMEYFNSISEGYYNEQEIIKKILPYMICYDEFFKCGIFTYVWNKIFKREIIYECQMKVNNEITVGEDACCVYPAIAKAKSIVILKEAKYHYRQRVGSILRSKEGNVETFKKIHLFNRFMKSEFQQMDCWNIVEKQLEKLYISHLMIMSDSVISVYPKLREVFPFDISKERKIILYSTGAFGIHLFQQFRKIKKLEIVAWTDPDYMEYKNYDMKIMSIENAIQLDYDKIVVASVDYDFVLNTRKMLLELNIKEDKIVCISQQLEQIKQMLLQHKVIEEY